MSVMCGISEVEWYVNMLAVQTLSLWTDRLNKNHIASGALLYMFLDDVSSHGSALRFEFVALKFNVRPFLIKVF